jgi:hypothetical protein
VRNIETAGNQIQALVQGTEPVPYRVTVRIEREFFGQSSIELFTRCTCPVGNRCKHAAALILAARRPARWWTSPAPRSSPGPKACRSASTRPRPAQAGHRQGGDLLPVQRLAGDDVEFSLLKARLGPTASSPGAGEWSNYEQALLKPPSFVRDEDMQVFRLLRATARKRRLRRPPCAAPRAWPCSKRPSPPGAPTWRSTTAATSPGWPPAGPAGRLEWHPAPAA